MDHAQTLIDMAPETRSGWRYLHRRENRTVLLPIRVSPKERDAIRAAARWENKTVAGFIRAAIAVRARDGYCKHNAGDAHDQAE